MANEDELGSYHCTFLKQQASHLRKTCLVDDKSELDLLECIFHCESKNLDHEEHQDSNPQSGSENPDDEGEHKDGNPQSGTVTQTIDAESLGASPVPSRSAHSESSHDSQMADLVAFPPEYCTDESLQSFARLSLGDDCFGTSNQTPPGKSSPLYHASSVPSTPHWKKWYVVTRGKRCGVFTDWNYVKALTSGVPNNAQKSFKKEADAYASYDEEKRLGNVEVVRVTLQDDITYGPAVEAIE